MNRISLAAAVTAGSQGKVRTALDLLAKMGSLVEAAREGLAHHLTRLANTVAPVVAPAVATTAAAAAVAALSSTTQNTILMVLAVAVAVAAQTTSSRARKYWKTAEARRPPEMVKSLFHGSRS